MRGTTRAALAAAAAGILAAAFAVPAPAQDGAQEAFRKKYEDKVGEAWFKDYGWTDDYEAARASAKKDGKPIFAYFTRSYSP